MFRLWKLYLAILIITTSEGGMNTIYPPFLEKSNYAVEQIGLILALFGVTQFLARLPVGTLYGQGRAKLLYVSFVGLYGLSTVGFAYPGGRAYLIGMTLIHGFAFGAIGTVMLAWIIELKPANSSHGASMGWYTAALSAGFSVGNFCSGYLADHWGYAFAFLVIGVLPAFSILISLTLPVSVSTSVKPSNEDRALSFRARLMQSGDVITPGLLLATLIAFYFNVLDSGFAVFFPLFGLSVGLSLTFIGLLRSIKSLTATCLRPLSGTIFRYINFRTFNNFLIIVWTLIVVLLPSLREMWMFVLVFIVFGACRGLLRVTSATMLAEEPALDAHGIGIASGLYNAGMDVGKFTGPLIGGYVASFTGIATMFRIVPLALLAIYFPLAVWIGHGHPVVRPQDEESSV